MDDKPAKRPAAKELPPPKGMDIRRKLKEQAEAKPEEMDKPEPQKKKPRTSPCGEAHEDNLSGSL
jgi:hypothetical protein